MRAHRLILCLCALALVVGAQIFSGGSGGTSTGSTRWADAVTPTQTSTLVYTLPHTPSPAASLQLHVNGLLMKPSVDYTLAGSTVTFVTGYSTLLATSQTMVAFYRY